MLRDYLDWLRNKRQRTAVTTYGYASSLAAFLDWIGTMPLEDVPLATLEAFVHRPRRYGRVGAPATQAKDVAILRAMYQYLVDRGLVARNPAALLHAPPVHNQNPRPIPDDDWIKLWAAARPGAERVFLGLGFFVGLRRREICELRPEQVFLASGSLVDFKRKGGGEDTTPYADMCAVFAQRMPKLRSEELEPVLAAHLVRRHGHPFVLEYGEYVSPSRRERQVHALPAGMTDPQILNRRMAGICQRAGISSYTPHQLRHSAATNLLRCDVPLALVQRLMNHSSPNVTMRYIRAGGNELREWMRGNGRH